MVITTVETINDALFHLSSEDVHRVYVDLDETIIAAEPDASPFFERALNAELKRVHPALDGDAAFRTTCAIWCSLQAVCDVDVVEPPADTARFLRSLRARGVEVVGLTARGPDIVAETSAQLARAGVADCFARSSLGPLEARPERGRPQLTHAGGVVYCAGSRKPRAMRAYEAKAPSGGVLVLVDDLRSHLEAAERATGGRRFLGLHYTRAAARPAYRDYALPRLGALLAAALARSRGRAFLRAALDAAEPPSLAARVFPAAAADGEAPPRPPAPRLAPLVAAFAAGAAVAAVVLARRRL